MAFRSRWTLIVGAAGWLLLAGGFSGCSSSDPNHQTGTGGTGGSMVDCTGDNEPTMILTSTCTISPCHNSSTASSLAGGLDLTPDANIKSRLVGVKSSGKGGSACGSNTTPYLNAGSNPATGLFIDKLGPNPPCGVRMPQVGTLTSTQQQCLKNWATSLTTQ
jgi:hypothetical protein